MKDEIITLPLGFRFVVGNDIVEIQEDDRLCSGCLFDNGRCSRPWSNIVCSATQRSDRMCVCFVKVGEVKP